MLVMPMSNSSLARQRLPTMSGYQQGQGHGQGHDQGHRDYDDGYGHQGNTDSYYQDDQQYYDNTGHNNQRGGQQQGDGYYDESYVAAHPLFMQLGPFH